jgi:plasmid maintenance system antidote protein VapI
MLMIKSTPPPHPGTVLGRTLSTKSISRRDFAGKIGVDETSLKKILEGEQDIDVPLSAAIYSQLGDESPTHLYQLQQDHNRWKKIRP